MSSNDDVKGPFILWLDFGYEGWKPQSFNSLDEAIKADKFMSEWIITKPVDFKVIEK